MQEHCAKERRAVKENIERNFLALFAALASVSWEPNMRWWSIALKMKGNRACFSLLKLRLTKKLFVFNLIRERVGG